MTEEPPKAIKLFYCYARVDKALRDELEMHLSSLKRQRLITTWYDREISPGVEWEREIDIHLNTAHIILLLVSPSFMASEYCYGIEMKRALERHEAGTARVIPIILRPVYWEDAPFSKLQMLPKDALPVTRWSDRDDAFLDIAKNIHRVVKELLAPLKTKKELLAPLKTKEEWLDEGNALRNLKHYEEALTAYEQAIRLSPNLAAAHQGKGFTFNEVKRYEDAWAAAAYRGKGFALNELKRYGDALAAYEQAICLDPNNAVAYQGKGTALEMLGRKAEAQKAFQRARKLGFRN